MGTPSVPATRTIDAYLPYERMGLAYETLGELDKSVAAFVAAYRLASAQNADYQPGQVRSACRTV